MTTPPSVPPAGRPASPAADGKKPAASIPGELSRIPPGQQVRSGTPPDNSRTDSMASTAARPASIPLALAYLCCDCDSVLERAARGECGVCGSHALLSLARLVNRGEVARPEAAAPSDAEEAARHAAAAARLAELAPQLEMSSGWETGIERHFSETDAADAQFLRSSGIQATGMEA